MRPRPFFIPFSILESRCHLNELECKRMHGSDKDETRRNKATEVGRKERKKRREKEREREREWERERESRVGILWVGRRSPPQLSFDLRRPPELPPPRTHAPLLFYPLGERFRESKVLLTVHALVLVVIVGKGMTPVRLFFHIRPPSLFPPPQHARTYRQTYASCSFFRLLFIKRIHCLVRETILLVFESLDQNGILCSSNGYNVDTTTVKRVVYYLTGTVWWCVYAIL